ncbi:hypothetical protein [Flavobacterium sp.]|uniref:hypothetical protein n=1 Tax=Flavobacterium sp. TaxID=239 RepID=UPI002C8054D1|nr:hypothetical protein [Flavobacterium sp.]HSD06905.1 hypothetical protein [Flavobacterium sp.]
MKTKKNFKSPLILCLCFCCFFLVWKTTAQDTVPANKKWHYLVQPYVLFPNMTGTVGLGSLPNAELDVDPKDIFSHLHLAAMLFLEAKKGKWAINSDLVYMHLTEGVKNIDVVKSGEVHISQLAWELAGLYQLNPWLEVGAGTRLNNITNELDLNISQIGGGTQNRNKKIPNTWLDPILVTRVQIPYNKWLFHIRADIGGFGVGSDFAYQAQADIIYNLSKKIQTSIGYRMINMDYETGSGEDRFFYDVTTFGANMKIGFKF